jgi:F-type H+-transporting ATPase subunit gamma
MNFAQGIRSKIQSIKNTQKITRAMEMVAASKMRKAQERMNLSRPYAQRISEVIQHIAHSHTEYRHPYLIQRNVKRVGFIIVTTDRGLCGSLNTNLLKTVVAQMKVCTQNNQTFDLALIGRKAEAFFKRVGGNVLAQVDHIGDRPQMNDLIGVVATMLTQYQQQNIDQLFLAHNEFVSTMLQKPLVIQLLPITAQAQIKHHWDYLYEPEPKLLLDLVFQRYIESKVYQGVIENISSELAARMIAMKNATDNAGELINQLNLAYNKARQASITKELAEIVAGTEGTA